MKRFLSLILALIMILSCCAVFTTAADENTTIYFEVPRDWNNVTQIMCYIYEYGTGNKFANWETKKTYCTDEGNGIWSYDTVAKTGKVLEPGKVYAVIFNANTGLQTYDLLLSSACYGDTAYCDGTKFENPADSSRTAFAAYWRGQNKSVYGPIMGITSIGTVQGTVVAPGETASSMFTKFLNDILPNARTYSGKSDQEIVDDIAKKLGLDNNTIDKLIRASGVEVDWVNPNSPVYPSSKLLYGDLDFDGKITVKDATIIQKYVAGIAVNSPVGSAIPNKIYFEVPDFWKNWKSLYCHIFEIESGETLANWQTKKEKMVDEGDGIYSYNFDIVGGLCEDVEYGIIFSADTGAQTYPLKFNSDYIGKTAYCVQDTSSGPADNTTPLAYAYWRSDDGTSPDVTPTDPVTPPENLLYGDLDFDGKVTIKDATIIQKYVAGIAVNSPVGSYIK